MLIDAGVSCARIVAELRKIGISPAQLSGVLVTHEHIDHIRGVGVLSRKYDLPVFATEGTWAAMEDKLGGVAMKNMRVLEPMEDFYLGGMNITAFDIPHDAAQPVGYSIALGGARLSVATDIGCVRDSWMNAVAGSDAVVLESNYDPDMLRAGPYPYALKQRILGRRGHLANDDAGRAAVALVRHGARRIILGHLSKENNFPALAEKFLRPGARRGGRAAWGGRGNLRCQPRWIDRNVQRAHGVRLSRNLSARTVSRETICCGAWLAWNMHI